MNPVQQPLPLEATEGDPSRWIDVALDVAILRCDHAGRIVETRGPPELLPVDAANLVGRRVSDIESLPAAMRRSWWTALERCLDTQRAQIAAFELDRGDAPRAYEARMTPFDGAAIVSIRDVTERDLLRGRVEALALVDPITGVGNLRVLRERLEAWTGRGAEAAPVALLLIDLDRFKQANDLHGRSIGDSLLRLVAQRLQRETVAEWRGRAFDATDDARAFRDDPRDASESAAHLVVVRVGGDEFAIAWRIEGRGDLGDAALALAHRLIAALAAPTRIAGQTLFVRASIGVAVHPDDAHEPALLLSHAEAALRRAKRAGRNQARRHGDDAVPRTSARPPTDETAMRAALAADQFFVVYQPKFELSSSLSTVDDDAADPATRGAGAIVAVEALVRWRMPSGGWLVPQDFIPLAETSGMIRPLGDWVLRTALAEVARFAERGARRVGVAVNVSLLQLHDREFVRTVAAALREFGFEPGELTLELAETAFVDDVRLVADALAELSASGVRLAVDHFGVGTAGFVALKSLPIDEVKIDRSFIAGAAVDAFDATIVRGLVEMAHNLGKTVTADGVERVDQIAGLKQMRCDAIQGYFIGEPMTATELVAVGSLWRRGREG